MSTSGTTFTIPPELAATEPPEARGLARDEVRLLVAGGRVAVRHATFRTLPDMLRRGDLVVVNTSDTEPAAVDGHRCDGTPITVHVSGPAPDGLHVVEMRTRDGHRVTDGMAGEFVSLPCGVVASLLTGHPDPLVAEGSRLWRARIPVAGGLRPWLAEVGRPIRYSYLHGQWPLESYRTVFARPEAEFGSAEMPSAGRPFTPELITRLVAKGVAVTPVVLHTGVASLEADETPYPERMIVPAATAVRVNATKAAGGRVLAVGTTVVRALESAVAADGLVRPRDGWTDLLVTPERGVRVVDGLLTGWHEPEASHLLMLEAIAGRTLLERSYEAGLAEAYLWHEFGDVHLILA